MSAPTEAREFEQWSAIFERVWRDPQILDQLQCPSCGSRALNLLYVLEDLDASHGMSAFWCGNCLTGYPPGMGLIPEAAQRVRRGEEQIPDYRLVLDT